MACLCHFALMYFLVESMTTAASSRIRKIAAPLTLALYIQAGLDWPSFLGTVFIFVLLSGKWRVAVLNPYNLIPVLSALLQLSWSLYKYLSCGPACASLTMFIYPFKRLMATAASFPLSRVLETCIQNWGPMTVLAPAGLVIYVWRSRRRDFGDPVFRALMDSMCVWLVLAGFATLKSAVHPSYVYVVAMPAALFAGLTLSKLRPVYIVACALLMATFGFHLATKGGDAFKEAKDKRIPAAAAFLIEQRPDLLEEGKTAFLPRNHAACVGQYARGRNRRIVMPKNFPVERYVHSIGSDEKTLLGFVEAYERDRRIPADWLILDTGLFGKEVAARDFYLSLSRDPNIKWIAQFPGEDGSKLYLGEIGPSGGVPVGRAPVQDVSKLAAEYESKYDRIGFLKRNVQFIDHY
jgi:hypothetical protein